MDVKKPILYKSIGIAFALIPVLALIRLHYYTPALRYGHGEITINSILLLLWGIYSFIVSTLGFIQCHNCWKSGEAGWKTQLIFNYIFIFVIAFSLQFLMTIYPRSSYRIRPEKFVETFAYVPLAFILLASIILLLLGLEWLRHFKTRPKSSLLIILYILVFTIVFLLPVSMVLLTIVFYSQDLLESFGFIPPAFVFPIGIVLFFLGFNGLLDSKLRPKSYLIVIFSTSILFALGGAPSALLVFSWWIHGGINPW